MAALAALPAALAARIPSTDNAFSAAKIIGGEATKLGEFPYILSLEDEWGPACGAVLLNADTVVTAANCIDWMEDPQLYVRAGSLETMSGGVTANVSAFFLHPNWNDTPVDNDIAVMKLSSPIAESPVIGYARLPPFGSDPSEGTILSVAGWGSLDPYEMQHPDALMRVDVPVVGRAKCQAQLSEFLDLIVTESMFCAGFDEGGQDACWGDSGGPIVDGSGTLVGLVSWGHLCAVPLAPGVYTRIGNLIDFIELYL
ncbi:trypsin-like cysteine/serine peptidase domain-containing protein [Stachybotrys elegans]|uniref:Trypsin-like cysteine/serine peptidase domain-containing protein n=1 Tax=Stachybotrys elegans TaxID=80388 RepID=A0A8K0SLK0_9HYPO|nr:trypsin-like cysteine/serine peptidase domain-containing protein [Stachybotrys elegans]